VLAPTLAKAILAQFGTFAEALNAPEEHLREVPRSHAFPSRYRDDQADRVGGISASWCMTTSSSASRDTRAPGGLGLI